MQKKSLIPFIKREMHLYWLNPATYIACAIFLFSVSIYFLFINRFFVLNVGSSDLRYFFNFFPIISILIIPTLTMGLWTKEDLESTLPISSRSMVISKWLCTVCIYMMCAFLSVSTVFIVSLFATVETRVLISSIIGIFFFICALCAFGQLCTVIFKNQAASFFVTALCLGLFTVNGFIANGVFFETSVFTSAARFFSFSWHFDAFSKGIIDTRSVFFFVCSAIFFLVLTVFILEIQKCSKHSKTPSKKLLHFKFIACVLLITSFFWNTQLYYKRFDITQTKRFSVSEYTEDIVSKIDSRLSISYYATRELQNIYPSTRDIEDFLYEYAALSQDIQVQVIHEHTESVINALHSYGVIAQNIPHIEQNKTSVVQAYSAIVLEYKESVEVIPFVLETHNLEYEMAGRLQSLTNTLSRSTFVVVANGLSLSSDYPLVKPFLESAGFSVLEIQPDTLLETSRLDISIPLIVIGSSQLHEEHTQAIQTYISLGGKVFFSVSPVSVQLDTWVTQYDILTTEPLFNLLQTYGIEVQPSLILDQNNLETQLLSSTSETLHINYPFFISITPQQAQKGTLLGDALLGLSLLWPSPIFASDPTKTTSIANTSSQSWLQLSNELLYEQTGSAFATNPFYEQNLRPYDEKMEQYSIAATYSNSIVLVPDQYFLSRALAYINQIDAAKNFDFLVNSLLWLQGNHELISLKSKYFVDYSLYTIEDEAIFILKKNIAITSLFLWYSIACFVPYIIITVHRKKLKRMVQQ